MRKPGAVWVLILLGSCQLAVNERVSLEDFDFSTTDPSELFFKNVRQSAYELEERSQAKMNVFRMSADSRSASELYPAIIHHWAIDKAYLWLEPGADLPATFEITIRNDKAMETIAFDGKSPKNHLEVATAVFHGILDESDILIDGREVMPRGSEARESYRVVLNDYYRLVELK